MNDELDDWLVGYKGIHQYAATVKTVLTDPIESATDEVLVFELIKRGYAVAKMSPEDLAKNV